MQEDYDIIDDYLDGLLPEDARASFEKRLAADKAFRQLFEQLQLVRDAVILHHKKELLKKLKTKEAQASETELPDSLLADALRLQEKKALLQKVRQWNTEPEGETTTDVTAVPSRSSSQSYRPIALALTTMLLLAAYFFWPFGKEVTTAEQRLIAQYSEPYPTTGIQLSPISDNRDSLRRLAMLHYGDGSWDKAIPLLQQIEKTFGDTIGIFYQGNAFLAKNESEKAIEAFQKFMPFSDLFDFTATTQWYLGLSYLSNQQKSEAIQQLRLLENDPDYGNKARQVIAEINQLAE